YAHLRDLFHVRRGLALDVPFGLVDFLEVLQAGQLATDIWYNFLNLGYKLTPAAGSDYPYTDLPGTDRNYVKVEGIEDTDSWFKSFKAGHVYVSNGPFLEFSVNGRQMGDEIHANRARTLTSRRRYSSIQMWTSWTAWSWLWRAMWRIQFRR